MHDPQIKVLPEWRSRRIDIDHRTKPHSLQFLVPIELPTDVHREFGINLSNRRMRNLRGRFQPTADAQDEAGHEHDSETHGISIVPSRPCEQ